MKVPTGIQVDETDDSVSFSWDNRTTRTSRFVFWFFILFLMVWVPATLLMSAFAFVAKGADFVFILIWLVFGWVGTIGIPYTLLGRRWRESITIDARAIILNYSGPLARKSQVIPLDQIVEISIGLHSDETMVTLNIVRSKAAPFWSRRAMVGYWLVPKLKEELFQAIEAFSETHRLGIFMIRRGQIRGWQ